MSGLASGIDWTSIVNELLTAEAAPETQMTTEQTTDNSKNAAYQTIGTDLTTLNTDITSLSNPSFFETRTATSSDSSIATATAASGTALGDYTFKVDTMATDSTWVGGTASAPFEPGENRKIAVKVIDDRGNELLVVKELKTTPASLPGR